MTMPCTPLCELIRLSVSSTSDMSALRSKLRRTRGTAHVRAARGSARHGVDRGVYGAGRAGGVAREGRHHTAPPHRPDARARTQQARGRHSRRVRGAQRRAGWSDLFALSLALGPLGLAWAVRNGWQDGDVAKQQRDSSPGSEPLPNSA
eukprot:829167-Prymnesium_polylepis.1